MQTSTRVQTHAHARTHTRTHARTHTHSHTHTHTHTHTAQLFFVEFFSFSFYLIALNHLVQADNKTTGIQKPIGQVSPYNLEFRCYMFCIVLWLCEEDTMFICGFSSAILSQITLSIGVLYFLFLFLHCRNGRISREHQWVLSNEICGSGDLPIGELGQSWRHPPDIHASGVVVNSICNQHSPPTGPHNHSYFH